MEARVGLKEEEEGLVWMTAAAACYQKESVQFGQLETHIQVVSVAECLSMGTWQSVTQLKLHFVSF